MNKDKLKQYKKDCDILNLTPKEYIKEAIATVENILKYAKEGFTRVEKCSLVALYGALDELDSKDKEINKLKETIEQKHITQEVMLGQILGQNITIERKNKIIELMAHHMIYMFNGTVNQTVEEIIKYFENKVKEE